MNEVTVAVIPAAGMGTRMLPATRVVPKELLPVAGKPMLSRAIAEACDTGIREIILVVSRDDSLVLDQFAAAPDLERYLQAAGKNDVLARLGPGLPKDCRLRWVVQDYPAGLGHALKLCQPLVGERAFAVLLADVLMDHPAGSDLGLMMRRCEARGTSQLLVEKVAGEAIARYGSVGFSGGCPDGNDVVEVVMLKEKAPLGIAPSDCAVVGRYVLTSDIFGVLEDLEPGHGGEIQLTDALNRMAGSGRVEAALLQGRTFDAGHLSGWLAANVYFAFRENPSDPEIQSLALCGLPEALRDAY